MKGNFIGKKPIYQSAKNRAGAWEIYDQSKLKQENQWFSSVDSAFNLDVDYWPGGSSQAEYNETSTVAAVCGGSISSDGKYLYFVGRPTSQTPDLFIYELVIPWKIGTARYTGEKVDLTNMGTGGTNLYITDDGNKLFGLNNSSDTIEQYSCSTNGKIKTLKYDGKSFNVAAQDLTPTGITFKPDGTKCYVVGSNADTVYQYTLSTAWDISTASYDSKSKLVSEDSTPTGITFKPDGTIFYITGNTAREVNQYTCSTAWDISTATYQQTIAFSTYLNSVEGLYFNADGTTLYLFGSLAGTSHLTNADGVKEFALSIAWDVSSFFIKGEGSGDLCIRNENTTAYQLSFKDDGTKLYFITTINDTIYQYSLSTAWDVSTASYDSKSFSVGTQDSIPYGLFFKSDGTKFYVVGDTNNSIYQYTCSTAWDISTASYDSKSLAVGVLDLNPRNIFLKPDGTKLYLAGGATDKIYQYSLSTAWDISTATSDGINYTISSQEATVVGLTFKDDGTAFYICGSTENTISQYSLSTAWDISTASFQTQSFDLFEFGPGSIYGLFFKPDGTRIFISGLLSIAQYECKIAWDAGALVQDFHNAMLHAIMTYPKALYVSEEGNYLYTTREDVTGTVKLLTFKFLEPYNLNTCVLTSQIKTGISGQSVGPQAAYWRADGQKLYLMNYSTIGAAIIYQYAIKTPWQMQTLQYESKTFSTSAQGTAGTGFTFKPDGTKLYVSLDSTDITYQYSLSTAWDVTTATYDSKSTAGKFQSMTFNADGTQLLVGMATTSGAGDQLRRLYTLSTAWDISTATVTKEIDLTYPNGESTEYYYGQFATYNGKLLYAGTTFNNGVIKMERE